MIHLEDNEIAARFDSGRGARDHAEQQARVRALEFAEDQRRKQRRRSFYRTALAIACAAVIATIIAL